MNAPILFIDEKPFWGNDDKAKEALRLLEGRLSKSQHLDKVDFFFQKNMVFPFDFGSTAFQDLLLNRDLVLIHNSYPHSKERTLFPLRIVNLLRLELKKLNIPLVRFSGEMYRRGHDDEQIVDIKYEQLKRGQPLIVEDLMIERDDVYDYFDLYVRHWVQVPEEPNYFVLKYGVNANKGKAEEIEFRMKSNCWENSIKDFSSSLLQAINNGVQGNSKIQAVTKRSLKSNWKAIVRTDLIAICNIAGFDICRQNKAIIYLESDTCGYSKYFEKVKLIIEKEIKPLTL